MAVSQQYHKQTINYVGMNKFGEIQSKETSSSNGRKVGRSEIDDLNRTLTNKGSGYAQLGVIHKPRGQLRGRWFNQITFFTT